MKKVNRFISMLLLIFMVLTMDLNGYSQIVKATTTNLVKKETNENLIITSFTADKISPQISGTAITLTAKATGSGTLQYRFRVGDGKGNYSTIKNYSTSNTATWNTNYSGSKILYVDVKDSNGQETTKTMNYVINAKSVALTISSFTTDKASPQVSGTAITLTAKATGSGTLQYRFRVGDGKGNYSTIKNYSTSNTTIWNAKYIGNKTLYVDVKDSSDNVVRKELKFVINEAKIIKERIPMENTIVSRTITEPTEIYWNEDTKLASYKLEYVKREEDINSKTQEEEDKKYITIKEGINIQKNDVLGLFDTTLLQNGLYKVRLTGKDINGNAISMSAIYLVSGNMKAGNFSLSYEDLNIPLDGLPITVVRNYDSRNKSSGDFGNGWSLALSDLKLEITANIGQDGWYQKTTKSGFFYLYEIKESKEHKVTVTYPTGEVEEFSVGVSPSSQRLQPIPAVTMTFTAKNGSKAQLRDLDAREFLVSGGATEEGAPIELFDTTADTFDPVRFEFIDKNGIKYIINKNTGVEKITYLDGDYVTINKTGLVYTSADGSKTKEVKITRDSQGRISSISDFDGKTVNYEYDAKGNLIKVTDREGRETSYTYDSDSKLSGIKGFGGYVPAKYEYDNNGRMIAYTDEYGVKTEFNFDEGAKQYVVKDALGNVEIYEYDSQGNITSYTDKENNKTLYEYDENNK
ncbi:MAG: DUF6531 domain-containing protein, partial [Clostridium sp.]|nr:DUF6531 domain-containing protein [Clostridium sp.]